jgi:flotillin
MSLTINAMTQEKLSLALPMVCTVGPEDTEEKLRKYAILLTGDPQQDANHVQNVIKGVVEGEIRLQPQ